MELIGCALKFSFLITFPTVPSTTVDVEFIKLVSKLDSLTFGNGREVLLIE